MAGSSKKGTSRSPRSPKRGRKAAAAPEPKNFDVSSEDYNIRSPERTRLLTQIKGILNNAPVSPAFWAFCQLADMNCLQNITTWQRGAIILGEKPLCFVPMQWNQRFRDSAFPGSQAALQRLEGPKKRKLNSDTQSSVSRSVKEADNCKKRDGNKCVLTRRTNPQAAHIFPHCMLQPRPRSDRNKLSNGIPDFWQSLSVFWGEDKINEWKTTVFPNSQNPDVGVERCFNLISLSPDAHDMWNRGSFALKPLKLSRDRKTLTVKFFWQAQCKYEIGSEVDLLTEAPSSEGLDIVGDGEFLGRLENDGSSLPRICSGETFTFTTKDPKNLPLPSIELLEMQWVLQRLVAMSGAAGWPSLDDINSDTVDDDYGWLIPDSTDYSMKRVCEWVGTEEAAGIMPEISTATPGSSMVKCH